MSTKTVGQVLEKLKSFDPEKQVRFAFCMLSPTKLMSYKGYYDQAAIGFDDNETMTVADMINDLEQAIDGRTFTGYKGGEYKYNLDTPLHVDNYGRCTSTDIKSIKEHEYYVFIKTSINED